MDDFCRAVFAFQFGPIDVFGGQSYLYDTKLDGGYVKLFGKDLAALSQSSFENLFGIWLICNFVDKCLKDDKKALTSDTQDEFDLLRKAALERKFLVFFAVGEVIREAVRLKAGDEDRVIRSYAKPRWQLENNRTEFIREAYSLASDMVVQAYQLAQKTPGFVHRNFFRDQSSITSLRSARASRRGQLQKLAQTISAG